MKRKFGAWYLGLDVGTDSVGWAVTDENYKVLKFNGKAMWGTHLFESGETATERRLFRCARRRIERRKQRLCLLRELFEKEIQTVDPEFFQRLEDSKFWEEDKKIKQKNTLFFDPSFTDKEFHQIYPTIYHLRSDLVHSEEKHDVRLIYLALHHIVKYRGHFLYEGQDFETASDFQIVFSDVLYTLSDYGIDFGIVSPDEIKEVLKNKEIKRNDKKMKLKKLMNADTPEKKAVAELIAGSKVSLAVIFGDRSLEDTALSKISFFEWDEEKENTLTDILQERMYLIQKLKSLYDWSVLNHILQDEVYLCDAKKRVYDEHKQDLDTLKKFLKKNKRTDLYKEILKSETTEKNYNAYVGKSEKKVCDQKDFCSFVEKRIKSFQAETADEEKLIQRLEEKKAFPKQVSKDNGVIPYQLHLHELEKILENAKKYLTFLNQQDEMGLTSAQKIKSLFVFKIPYYVGPLNPHSPFAWIAKKESKENEKIYPWSFDQVVDREKSADSFILRMTNKCTYLKGKDVLPKQSILYSKYDVLNQINKLRINGELLPVDVKQSLFEDLFLNVEKPKRVTIKTLKSYFKNKGLAEGEEIDITGIDTEIVGNLKALIEFRQIMKETKLSEDQVDEIIRKIVILGESKSLLKEHLQKEYSDILNEKQLADILKLKYSGWGRFSKEFLTEVCSVETSTGEVRNILTMLWETDRNLMQLLSKEYGFMDEVDRMNAEHGDRADKIHYNLLDGLYVSPAVKRSIWRALLICKELVKIMGHEPEKIFIEMARGSDAATPKGKKIPSRKERLKELFDKNKVEEVQLWEELNRADEGELRDNRLYLYYVQLGRCMYSNERIRLNDLYSLYDIDHIYPQSKVKDDSIHSNMVLVKKELNAKKGNAYPIPQEIVSKDARRHWSVLLEKELITKEKYNRLTRKIPFTENELSGFIARQLVETRQSTKAIAGILKEIFKKAEVVYVKAENVSDFRHKYEIVKSRLVNDFHHAKDAYLNVVVGNVYHEKFTSNPVHFIKKGQEYSLNRVFDFTVKKGDRMIWDSENAHSLSAVKKQAAKNNILFTRHAFTEKGGLFDQMPLKAGKGQYPLKTSDERLLQMEKYGAYNSVKGSYFFLVEYKEKGKLKKIIQFVPIYMSNRIKTNEDLLEYAKNDLNLKDARVLIPKIKINTLFNVNGFKMHLSGRTGDRLTFKGGIPLILSEELYVYAKKIEKYIERNKEKKVIYPITEHQKITLDKNLRLYDELLNKLKNTIYNTKLSSQVLVFENGRNYFAALDLVKQCEFIYNAFNLFDTTPALSDLSLINGAKNAGMLLLSKNISETDQISIIYQSVTGLFEKEEDLKSL